MATIITVGTVGWDYNGRDLQGACDAEGTDPTDDVVFKLMDPGDYGPLTLNQSNANGKERRIFVDEAAAFFGVGAHCMEEAYFACARIDAIIELQASGWFLENCAFQAINVANFVFPGYFCDKALVNGQGGGAGPGAAFACGAGFNGTMTVSNVAIMHSPFGFFNSNSTWRPINVSMTGGTSFCFRNGGDGIEPSNCKWDNATTTVNGPTGGDYNVSTDGGAPGAHSFPSESGTGMFVSTASGHIDLHLPPGKDGDYPGTDTPTGTVLDVLLAATDIDAEVVGAGERQIGCDTITEDPVPPEEHYATTTETIQQGESLSGEAPTHDSGSAATGYSCTPSPAHGVTFDEGTGIFGGTFGIGTTSNVLYTVTPESAAGDGTPFTKRIIILDPDEPQLAYPATAICIVGADRTISPTTFVTIGGSVSIDPALPTGLVLNTATGVIVVTGDDIEDYDIPRAYTLTLEDDGGEIQAEVEITINYAITFRVVSADGGVDYQVRTITKGPLAPPSDVPVVTYEDANPDTPGEADIRDIVTFLPTNTGGEFTEAFLFGGDNPGDFGLSINATTGRIRGKLNAIGLIQSVVRFLGPGGHSDALFELNVSNILPAVTWRVTFFSEVPNTLNPTTRAGGLIPPTGAYALFSGSFPTGVAGINPDTGVISGTPTVRGETGVAVISITNEIGTTYFEMNWTVIPPSYAYPDYSNTDYSYRAYDLVEYSSRDVEKVDYSYRS